MTRGYQREQTCVHLMNYHFIWCPKYRKKILIGEVKTRLTKLIKEKVKELDCSVLRLKIMPDHIYLFISAKPTLSPNRIIGEIKGYTSRRIRQEFPKIKSSLPSLWTRSYFISTAGNVSSSVIEKYLEDQIGR